MSSRIDDICANRIIDLRCSDDECAALYENLGNDRSKYQQNRNFIHEIKPGAIALVPRPGRGFVYAGRVLHPFKLLDDPPLGG